MSSSETYETRYGRYKRSTRNVAIWLAVTDLDFKPPQQGEYILTASQFVELANNIVAFKYADHVPRPIISDLRYTMDSRRAQSKFYQDEGSASCKSHQHFIQQLEQLYQTLRPLILDDEETPLDGDNEPDTAAMANRFDGLKIEEPSKEFLDAPDAPTRSTCPTENLTVEDSTDRVFGVLLLLQGLWSIRHSTQKTWVDYRQGKCTLEAAAVTTDIALHVAAELLQQGLKPFSEVLQGFEKIMTNIFQEMYRTAPQDRPHWHEVVRNLHMVAKNLHFVVGGWKEDGDGVLSEGTAPVLDLSRALDEMTDNERSVVAFVLLKEVVRECGLWGLHHPRLCATMDWFTMMLGHGLSQRAINYELAFGGIVYIDIRLAMGAEVAQPRLQLQEWTQSTTALIKATLQNRRSWLGTAGRFHQDYQEDTREGPCQRSTRVARHPNGAAFRTLLESAPARRETAVALEGLPVSTPPYFDQIPGCPLGDVSSLQRRRLRGPAARRLDLARPAAADRHSQSCFSWREASHRACAVQTLPAIQPQSEGQGALGRRRSHSADEPDGEQPAKSPAALDVPGYPARARRLQQVHQHKEDRSGSAAAGV
ncbi:uncharacterized protein BO95DRAFT_495510 [Aspergillus brunneoviolaceus CBS 621.78]|uniref:Uncharacterized protein n=1 Tax=Aspergillus brunneoviolaceus CBS 621.78 TaxID=1450534 RepID=A0ACD1GA61_9EURO|nr:hypothetical protein BO95DRAFT_495510 [Aspergillus brunneoviolaceus CBS 621.78]RAH46169.1 hypothetical protein BO95DRAFT_495510 [Aspergillus brunneoviolaceus CBS 621.78]